MLLALLTTASMAQKEALIVAIDDYEGTKYDLGGVKKDAVNVKALFESWGFHVTLVRNADSMNLEQYLQNASSSLRSDGKFIFYYSGHGFHVKDLNGDEADGEDEALVLSDGQKNELFLDDALFGYLNAIKAKKLVLLDSCHSGTAFKAFGDKPKPKSITQNAVSGVMKTKAFRPQESKIAKGEYIVFSAAQDKEESLDTSNGGLFTNAFLHQVSASSGRDANLMNLRQSMENEIVNYCQRVDATAHHPNLSASDKALKYSSINQFLETKTETVKEQELTLTGSKSFNSGEFLDFKIDTHNNSGYLSVFSIENQVPFMMYQSTAPQQGVFHLKDFNIQPPIECYKSCGNCPSEESVVYVAFSAKPIKIKINKNSKSIETSSADNFKAFRNQDVPSFKTIIKKFETTIY